MVPRGLEANYLKSPYHGNPSGGLGAGEII